MGKIDPLLERKTFLNGRLYIESLMGEIRPEGLDENGYGSCECLVFFAVFVIFGQLKSDAKTFHNLTAVNGDLDGRN